MIVISGITISNPIDTLSSVQFQVMDGSMNVLKIIQYTGQSEIYYQESSAGTYYIKITDGTSSEICEVTKNIIIYSDCFDYSIGTDNTVRVITNDNDNNCIIAGDFTTYGGVDYNYITKTNGNNIIDNNFNIGAGFQSTDLYKIFDVCVDDDNNYIVCGNFTSYSGITCNNIIKIDKFGSIINGFNTGSGFNSNAESVIFDVDKYVVVGNFTSYSGITCNKICCIDKNGYFDTSFNSGGTGFTGGYGYESITYKIIKDNNGNYLIGGHFLSYNGVNANRIIRLLNNGEIDPSFIYGTGFNNTVTAIIQLNNGQYLIGGDFTTYNGYGCNNLIKLNYNGSVDNTFTSLIFKGNSIYRIRSIIEYDNKYYIGGYIFKYNNNNRQGILRLNSDGTEDISFNVGGIGFSNTSYYLVSDILLLNDGIMVGGFYNKYNNTDAKNIIKLDFDGNIIAC